MEFFVSDMTLISSFSESSSRAAVTGNLPINSGMIPNLIRSAVFTSLKIDPFTFSSNDANS